MNRISKWIAGVLCGTMCFGSLVGCSMQPVSAESLLKHYEKQVESNDKMSFDMIVDMDMDMLFFGEKQNIRLTENMTTEVDGDNAHVYGSMSFDEGGETESAETEVYLIGEEPDGGGDIVYTQYTKSDDNWYASDPEIDVMDIAEVAEHVKYENFTLTEESDVYVVSGTIDTAEAMEAGLLANAGPASEMLGNMADMGIDLSSMVDVAPVKVEYRFDKTTRDMISMHMDMSEALNSMMTEMVKQAVESAAEENVESEEESSFDTSALLEMFEISVNAAVVDITNIQMGGDFEIKAPDESLIVSDDMIDDMTVDEDEFEDLDDEELADLLGVESDDAGIELENDEASDRVDVEPED